jgi:hypothetical protein
MYEQRKQPLASRKVFVQRVARNGLIGAGMILIALGIGVLGYHFLEGLSWIDALLNASMILGGMGPVNPLQTTAGKLFASFYALFSGVVFIAAMGVLAAPIFHRFMHHFHLEVDKD